METTGVSTKIKDGHVVSVRAAVVLLVDVLLPATTIPAGWSTGVPVISYVDHKNVQRYTGAEERATNFPRALHSSLYSHGGPVAPRTGKPVGSLPTSPVPMEGRRLVNGAERTLSREELAVLGKLPDGIEIRVTQTEILRARESAGELDAVGVLGVHLSVGAPGLDELTSVLSTLAWARRKRDVARGAPTLALLRSLGIMGPDQSTQDARTVDAAKPGGLIRPARDKDVDATVYPLVLFQSATSGPRQADKSGKSADGEESKKGLAESDYELYALAAGQPVSELIGHPERIEAHLSRTIRMSSSWSGLILRHGAAFRLDDPEFQLAEVYFRTLYTDAMMLARLQDHLVRSFEADVRDAVLVTAGNRSDLAALFDRVNEVDRSLALANVRYCMPDLVSNTGKAIDMVSEYHVATAFVRRHSALTSDVESLVQLSARDLEQQQARRQGQLTWALELLGAIAIPVTVILQIAEMVHGSPMSSEQVGQALVVALGTAAVCVGALSLFRHLAGKRSGVRTKAWKPSRGARP